MNKDQIKGSAKTALGKVQESAGKLVGSKEQQTKGLGKQLEGSAQKNIGNATQTIEETKATLKGSRTSR